MLSWSNLILPEMTIRAYSNRTPRCEKSSTHLEFCKGLIMSSNEPHPKCPRCNTNEYVTLDDEWEKSGKRVGAVAGGIAVGAGLVDGAALGATIGSIIPGAGTLIGGAAGAVVGTILGVITGATAGAKAGEYIGKALDHGYKCNKCNWHS
jgi:hypothetical protein